MVSHVQMLSAMYQKLFPILCIYFQGALKFYLAGKLRPHLGGEGGVAWFCFSTWQILTHLPNDRDIHFNSTLIKYFYIETSLALASPSSQELWREQNFKVKLTKLSKTFKIPRPHLPRAFQFVRRTPLGTHTFSPDSAGDETSSEDQVDGPHSLPGIQP